MPISFSLCSILSPSWASFTRSVCAPLQNLQCNCMVAIVQDSHYWFNHRCQIHMGGNTQWTNWRFILRLKVLENLWRTPKCITLHALASLIIHWCTCNVTTPFCTSWVTMVLATSTFAIPWLDGHSYCCIARTRWFNTVVKLLLSETVQIHYDPWESIHTPMHHKSPWDRDVHRM